MSDEMTIDEVLTALREESSKVQWEAIAGSVRFWDRQDWVWVKNPYKEGDKKVWPKDRYPDLTDEGIARMVYFNGLAQNQ